LHILRSAKLGIYKENKSGGNRIRWNWVKACPWRVTICRAKSLPDKHGQAEGGLNAFDDAEVAFRAWRLRRFPTPISPISVMPTVHQKHAPSARWITLTDALEFK
jgi:hypothetical protein